MALNVKVSIALRLAIAFGALITFPGITTPAVDTSVTYAEVVGFYNAGKYPEARDTLRKLLQQNPTIFKAYKLYWDLLARTKSADARLKRVGQDLWFLRNVPLGQRTEDFYSAYEYGLKLSDNSAVAAAIHEECLARFPRGFEAQQALLNSAGAEPDPRKAAALYENYIARFSDNASWTELAARDHFLLIVKHPDQFGTAQLLAAAQEWDRHQFAFFKRFGMPQSYVGTLEAIAKELSSSEPGQALEYCDKATKFIESEWPNSTDVDESDRFRFWPIALKARVELKQWPSAVRLGDELVKYIDDGAFLGEEMDRTEEVNSRLDLSLALEASGDIKEAAAQLGLAATLDSTRTELLNQFLARHPALKPDLTGMQDAWRHTAAEQQERREEGYRRKILGRQVKRPATAFRLPMVSGGDVSLRDFKGKPLVLAFWATWCGPCHGELENLNRFMTSEEKVRAALLTVSVDTEKSTVLPFAKKNGYVFPIAVSDGTIDAAYQTDNIPQLYVLDPNGNIRFHLTGYDSDGYFSKKLNWMIEAAASPYPVRSGG